MKTTIELLDAAKRATECETDYQLAKKFGLTLATVSRWRTGKGTFDDDHAALIAGILGRSEEEVMALCQAERAKDTTNRMRWLRAASLLAAAVLPPAAGASVDNNPASARIMRTDNTNYAKYRALLRWFLFGDWLRLA